MSSTVFVRYSPEYDPSRKKPYRFRWKEFGKLKKKWFSSEESGEDFVASRERELLGFGQDAVSIEDRFLMGQLKKRAQERGLPVMELLGDLLNPVEAAPPITLADAWAAFEIHNREIRLSVDMQASYRLIIERFIKGRENLPLAKLTPLVAVNWLLATYEAESTRRTNRARLVTFFHFCARPSEGRKPWDTRPWLPPDFAKAVNWKSAKTGRRRPKFFRLPVLIDLLHEAPAEMQPVLVLQTLGGIRPRELTRERRPRKNDCHKRRLRWEDIDFERRTIYIVPEVSKTNDEWLMHDLPDNFWAWMDLYRWEIDEHGEKRPRTGDIWPFGLKLWKDAHKQLRKDLKIEEWPRDVLRHCFATNAYWKGLEWALDKMRHEKDSDTFVDHYKGNVTELEAKAFHNWYPDYCLWPRKPDFSSPRRSVLRRTRVSRELGMAS